MSKDRSRASRRSGWDGIAMLSLLLALPVAAVSAAGPPKTDPKVGLFAVLVNGRVGFIDRAGKLAIRR